MRKAELARKAGGLAITVTRIEKGLHCRLETKRKIIVAFGYDLSDRDKIFVGADLWLKKRKESTKSC